MARLKAHAVPHVEPLLREGNPDERFFAVLLAGSLRQAALLPALAKALFDPVAEVAAAARAAAGSLRMLPGFEETVLRPLRAELGGADPDRIASAALAIGRARDVQAIPPLIPLTGHADDRVAAEASDALTQITKQTHGDSPRRWTAWWESNKNRPRVEWLVEGLAHKDLQVRLSSIDELVEITSDSMGYLADGPRKERERALEKWDAWLKARVR
jgi:HEAT repeat protein